MRSETLKSVISDLESREKTGLSKYNTTVDRTDLSQDQWLQHAYEEALDMAMYLKRAMTEPSINQEKASDQPKPESVGDWLMLMPDTLYSELEIDNIAILEWPCYNISDALSIATSKNRSMWFKVVKNYNKTRKFPNSLSDIS